MAKPRRKGRRISEEADDQSSPPAEAQVTVKDQSASSPSSDESVTPDLIWSPSIPIATLFIVLVRMLSAGTTCIGDCDETFNYWEPLHYLLYGFGFQTWEYAPQYALRSYAYLMPSFGAAKASQALLDMFGYDNDKPQVWLGVRLFHVVTCAVCEVMMYSAVKKRFGRRAGGFFLLLSGMSAGMFVAGPALLPSSSGMVLVMAVYALWCQRRFMLAIPVAMVCVFGTGWPFVGVLFVPMLFHCAWNKAKEGRTPAEGLGAATAAAVWVLICGIGVTAVVIWVDSGMYGQTTSPTFNIIKYNVLDAGQGRGDELYGTEPATYYIKNLLLNTSLAGPLAFALPFVSALVYPLSSKAYQSLLRQRLLFASPAMLWLTLMFLKPHKEERFLYPVYPVLFLSAAFTLDMILELRFHIADSAVGLSKTRKASIKMIAQMMAISCVFFAAVLGMCRTAAVVRFHNAPCNIFKYVYYKELSSYRRTTASSLSKVESNSDRAEKGAAGSSTSLLPPVRLCVGGEWHRFPSSFYLPHKEISLNFLRSNFHGQLPQPFVEINGTSAAPLQPFNDLNREEEARFSRLKECDYVFAETLWDKNNTRTSDVMFELARTKGRWKTMTSHNLLDAKYSDPALRAFFIPIVSERFVAFGRLSLFKRIMPDPPKEKRLRNV